MKKYLLFCMEAAFLLFVAAGCTSPARPTEIPPASTDSPSISPTIETASEVGSVRPIAGMKSARAVHTATLLRDGHVLIAGGFGQGGDDNYTDGTELYDPAAEDFVPAGRMGIKRCCHTATLLPDGRVLIAGGFNGEYLSNAEIYDPATGKFSPTGSLTTARMDHVAVLLDNGKVLLAGGVGTGWTFLSSAELYDPATGAFTPTGSMAVARESHTATKLQDGRVLVTGGHQGRQAAITVYDSVEIYDPASGLFIPAGSMQARRHKHDAVLLRDGKVLITGGSDERDDRGAYTSAEIYDPASDAFTTIGNMPGVRYKHVGTSLLLKNGTILLAGGGRNAVLYDPQHNTFSIVPGNLGAAALSRLFSTATLLENGSVLITGGYGIGQNVSAGAWIYEP